MKSAIPNKAVMAFTEALVYDFLRCKGLLNQLQIDEKMRDNDPNLKERMNNVLCTNKLMEKNQPTCKYYFLCKAHRYAQQTNQSISDTLEYFSRMHPQFVPLATEKDSLECILELIIQDYAAKVGRSGEMSDLSNNEKNSSSPLSSKIMIRSPDISIEMSNNGECQDYSPHKQLPLHLMNDIPQLTKQMTSPSPQHQTPLRRPLTAGSASVSPYHTGKRSGRKAVTVGNNWDDRAQTTPSRRPGSACSYNKRQMKPMMTAVGSGGGNKMRSSENWIPEDIRRRMVQRDLTVAKQNFEAKEICLASSQREMKHFKLNSLERSRSKEKYGIETRKTCGLCGMAFLPVNLTLAVPLKAVLDIRDSWGDKFDPVGNAKVRVNPNLRRAPACYNQTRVCAFCAQLFDQQQETYRPSWEAKEAERERMKRVEDEERQKVLNDPLAQVERERADEVSELTKALDGSSSLAEENGVTEEFSNSDANTKTCSSACSSPKVIRSPSKKRLRLKSLSP